jgi:dipeptidyl aminopeptidase/acylaminoacyl peptidase
MAPGPPITSAPARRPFEPRDITRIRWIADPHISPDGRRVAFVVTTLSEDRDEYLSSVWMVDTGGGEPRRFTNGPKRDTAPRWSPDGTRLAFLSEREGKKKAQLYVMPADGGEPTRLTDLKNGVADPEWSPDGTRLAFLSRVGGWQEPESEEEKQKSKPARVITTLKYRFNAEGWIYDRPTHLFVVGADGGAPRQLTDGDFHDSEAAWSPDGKRLVFASARHDGRDEDDARDVWVVDATGGDLQKLTETGGPVALPAFSTDGRRVAYLGRRPLNEIGRNLRLYTVPAAGGVPACLTPDLDRSCPANVHLMWSPDGEWVTFSIEDRGDLALYRVRADGAGPATRITTGERCVTGATTSADGRVIAFAATAPLSPAEVFVCGPDGTHERQVTDLNRDWKAEVALAAPERFTFERAGFTIDGWVMKPFGFTEGVKYPALLNVHGGPHTQYANVMFDEFQAQAGAGHVVIYTNPRGSQGYGEAFTRAVVGDWGGGDYADVMAGLDEALRRFDFIDPARLGILGGSYGGFMTSWAVGHTRRFKAACSERAVNNQYTMFGTSDIGHWFQLAQNGPAPWDNMAWYVERSPLTYAKDIVTPLLIIHSEDDLRCPIEQAEQLFVALKKLHRDVVFVRFPDENHELSRSGKPRHRLERFRLILEWFAKYL